SVNATIVMPCDMPYLTEPCLEQLVLWTGEPDAVVPRTTPGYRPLCAAYTRACLAPAAARLAEGRLKMAELFEDVRVRVVTEEEIASFGGSDRLLTNVNTPAEYGRLEAFHGHQL